MFKYSIQIIYDCLAAIHIIFVLEYENTFYPNYNRLQEKYPWHSKPKHVLNHLDLI